MRLSDGREFFAKTIISNATRWDTFGRTQLIAYYSSRGCNILFFPLLKTLILWSVREAIERRKTSEGRRKFSKSLCQGSFFSFHSHGC